MSNYRATAGNGDREMFRKTAKATRQLNLSSPTNARGGIRL